MPQYTTKKEASYRQSVKEGVQIDESDATRVSKAMGGTGKTATAASTDFLNFQISLQEEENTIAALDANNELAAEAMQMEVDLQEKYQGSNAKEYGKEFEKWYQKRSGELGGKLKNPHTKRMFGVRSKENRGRYIGRAVAYMSQEHQKAQANSADLSFQTAVRNVHGGMSYDDALAKHISDFDSIYRNKSPEDVAAVKMKIQSELATEYFTSLLGSNPWRAMKEIQAWSRDANKQKILSPAAMYEFKEKAQGIADKKQADALYRGSIQEFGTDPEHYEDRVNWIRSREGMTPDAIRIALSDIGVEYNNTHYLEEQAEAEKRENAMEKIYEAWNGNDFQTATKLIDAFHEDGVLSEVEVARLRKGFSDAGPTYNGSEVQKTKDQIDAGEIASKADVYRIAPRLGKNGVKEVMEYLQGYNKEETQLLNSIKKNYKTYFADWDEADNAWWDMRQIIQDDWKANGGSLADKRNRAIELYKKEEETRSGVAGWWNKRWGQGELNPFSIETNAFKQDIQERSEGKEQEQPAEPGQPMPPPHMLDLMKTTWEKRNPGKELTDQAAADYWRDPVVREEMEREFEKNNEMELPPAKE